MPLRMNDLWPRPCGGATFVPDGRMDQPDRIHLRDYVVSAEIGAFQSERGSSQRLRFAIEAALSAPVTGADDQVDRILSYDVLTDAVRDALADRRYDLVETLAERIAAQVLVQPMVTEVSVTVEKLDRGPGALGVTLVRRQGRETVAAAAARPDVLFRGAPVAVPPGPLVIVPDAPRLPLPHGGDARRIALLALDQAAWALAGQLGLTVADSRTEIDWAAASGLAVVWAPARMVADVSDLPADPQVLAPWLAERLGAGRLLWALPKGVPMPVALAGIRAALLPAAD